MNNLSQEWIAHTILSWQGDHYTAAELIWKNIQIELNKDKIIVENNGKRLGEVINKYSGRGTIDRKL